MCKKQTEKLGWKKTSDTVEDCLTSHVYFLTVAEFPSLWLRGKIIPPVVHLPQLGSHPHLPHTHQSLASAAHDLPVVNLNGGDTQVVAVQGRHRGAGSQVKHPHPETQ